MFSRQLVMTSIAWSFIGKPYRWGGDDPMRGFDCSGFVIELLKSEGLLRRGVDLTAQGLYEHFRSGDDPKGAYEGYLAFWKNKDGRVIHVEYCIDQHRTIGASGGGSKTLTERDAVKQNAYVKVRPIREGAIFVDPFKGLSNKY